MYFFTISVVALWGAITISAQDAEKKLYIFNYNELVGINAAKTKFGLTQLETKPCEINGFKLKFVCHPKDESVKVVLTVYRTDDQNDVIKGECVLLSSQDTTTLIDTITGRKYTAIKGITATTLHDDRSQVLDVVTFEAETTTCLTEEGAVPDKSLWRSIVCTQLAYGYYIDQLIDTIFLKTAVLNDDGVPVTSCPAT